PSTGFKNVPRGGDDPFAVIDPQNWANPVNMTWADWQAPPGTNWSDPSTTGSIRNFNIALITVDYPDKAFEITLPAQSTIYGNPQPVAGISNITRDTVPAFYRDFLNKPGTLNRGHTLHEYWMEDSDGRFGVDLTVYGAYEMPLKSYQYGIDDDMNTGGCPPSDTCSIDIRTDALGTWRTAVGNATADSYELVFILSAGQDESSTWQEFGEMKFQTREDVPDKFGPPDNGTNYAKTRYVDWTSWAAASNIWPNAGGGSSTQAESSGMATYAHEFSHLLSIGDNYNNPYGIPLRRSYTGPWSMMSRGSFNGPGGPHTRWQIPPQQGGSMGSLHTVRDKAQLGLVGEESILNVSREALTDSGIVVAQIQARAVSPGTNLMGIRITMDADNEPYCDIDTEVLCDGGGYNAYFIEVVDRMGADSFTPDSGVMISKTKVESDEGPFQWTIDANPQDIQLLDFYRPNGTASYVTMGDYRQLLDALFHAGTRSGSQYEYVDEANSLHFYVVDVERDSAGVLAYTAAVRSTNSSTDTSTLAVTLSDGKTVADGNTPTGKGVTCSFHLKNTGESSKDGSAYLDSDVYRLNATVHGSGWNIELPNALATAELGEKVVVKVAVSANADAADNGTVTLTAISELDPTVSATGSCVVHMDLEK
ncbi:putative secreted metallopeptidase, partial [Lachnellula occidentalis]